MAADVAAGGITLMPDQSLRDEFSCPITCDLMRDPVIAADGHTVRHTPTHADEAMLWACLLSRTCF